MYESEWHNIKFTEFTNPSVLKLAGAEFYDKFYKYFFRKYHDWKELSPEWLGEKQRYAEFIYQNTGPDQRILSVGCGLGAIEHFLLSIDSNLSLSINDLTDSAWKWIRDEIHNRHAGNPAYCLDNGCYYDFIYLSSVDYAIRDDELINLLKTVGNHLGSNGRGKCMLLSASFQYTPVTIKQYFADVTKLFKENILMAGGIIGMYDARQFWGWRRTAREYRDIMIMSGFGNVKDGFLFPEQHGGYWVAGEI